MKLADSGGAEEALAKARDAVRSGDVQLADQIISAATQSDPSNLDLNLFFATLPSRNGDDQLAMSRLSDLSDRFGGHPWVLTHMARTASRMFDFENAIALANLASDKNHTFREREQTQYQLMTAWLAAQRALEKTEGQPDFRALMINLDHDTARFELCQKWFGRLDVTLERVGGVRGKYLPEYVSAAVLAPGRTTGPGTLGCFLSHVSAWERAASSDMPHTLILEDDARPLMKFGTSFGAFGTPDDYDICFVNRRMTPSRMTAEQDVEHPFVASPLHEVFACRPGEQRGAGFDGYFLSKAGAAKLLNILNQDRVLGHVDMQVLSCCLTKDALSALSAKGSFFSDLLRYSSRRTSSVVLNAYCLWPPLVHQEDHGGSTHQKENASVIDGRDATTSRK